MRIVLSVFGLALMIAAGLGAQGPAPGGGGTGPQIVWSPKAAAPQGWTAPHRPHT
jgi:hypothetical protein